MCVAQVRKNDGDCDQKETDANEEEEQEPTIAKSPSEEWRRRDMADYS